MTSKAATVAVVQLPVKDLEASVKWYQDVMEIPFTFEFKEGDNEAWLNVGGIGLGLVRSPIVPKLDFDNMLGQAQPLISFRVENIKSLYQEMKNKGIELSEMTYKKSGGYSFTLRDPDGHISSLWGGWPSAEDELANS